MGNRAVDGEREGTPGPTARPAHASARGEQETGPGARGGRFSAAPPNASNAPSRRCFLHQGLLLAGVALIALCAADVARANTPPVWTSTIPSHVRVVGRGVAGPDTATGHVHVVVRDLANYPIAGSQVVFDFGACPDVALALDQGDPRLGVNCTHRWVTATTDANGRADFTIVGRGTTAPAGPARGLAIIADGVLLGYVSVAVFERDGVPGLTGPDLGLFAVDLLGGTHPARSDFDGNGSVDSLDLSVWAAAYFSGNNTEPIGAVCP